MKRTRLIALYLTLSVGSALAGPIERQPSPRLPISQAIRIPGNAERLILSGQTASPITAGGVADRIEHYGDTRTQAASVLKGIVATLADHGYAPGDVVRMQAFLVGDPNDPNVELEAFNAAYDEVFGTAAQPNRPTRSLFQVVRLARPWFTVEIEVEAAKVLP